MKYLILLTILIHSLRSSAQSYQQWKQNQGDTPRAMREGRIRDSIYIAENKIDFNSFWNVANDTGQIVFRKLDTVRLQKVVMEKLNAYRCSRGLLPVNTHPVTKTTAIRWC